MELLHVSAGVLLDFGAGAVPMPFHLRAAQAEAMVSTANGVGSQLKALSSTNRSGDRAGALRAFEEAVEIDRRLALARERRACGAAADAVRGGGRGRRRGRRATEGRR